MDWTDRYEDEIEREEILYRQRIDYLQYMACIYFRKHKELLENKDILTAYKLMREESSRDTIAFIDVPEEVYYRVFDEFLDDETKSKAGIKCEAYKKEIMLYSKILVKGGTENQKKKLRALVLDDFWGYD